jgi:hypothetical protein
MNVNMAAPTSLMTSWSSIEDDLGYGGQAIDNWDNWDDEGGVEAMMISRTEGLRRLAFEERLALGSALEHCPSGCGCSPCLPRTAWLT